VLAVDEFAGKEPDFFLVAQNVLWEPLQRHVGRNR
jgi:hypothetical protein